MTFAMNDIQRFYRTGSSGSPCDAIRVAHRLGAVWYAGRDRLHPPEPTLAGQPWMQIGVVPRSYTDGVEDRVIVADAELARHGLAWRLDAPENAHNVFVRLAAMLDPIPRVERAFGADVHVTLTGIVRHPLASPSFVPRGVALEGRPLGGPVLAGALDALGLPA